MHRIRAATEPRVASADTTLPVYDPSTMIPTMPPILPRPQSWVSRSPGQHTNRCVAAEDHELLTLLLFPPEA